VTDISAAPVRRPFFLSAKDIEAILATPRSPPQVMRELTRGETGKNALATRGGHS
jgi:hypothetical protein